MPGPVPLRALPVVRQGRIPSLDDEKVTLSMNLASASSSSSSSTTSSSQPSATSIEKRSNQEVSRLVREAMSVGIQSHAAASSSTHFSTIDFEKVIPTSSGRAPTSLVGKKGKLNEKQSATREWSNSSNGYAKGRDRDRDTILCVEIVGPGSTWEYSTKQQSGKNVFHVTHAKSSSHNPFNVMPEY